MTDKTKTVDVEYVNQLINMNQVDQKSAPLFFASEKMGLQTFDNIKYQEIKDLYEMQFSFLWRPGELVVTKDRSDFASMSEDMQFIFIKNISYQILLDSIQSRGVLHLLENCTNIELEQFIQIWAFAEGVHSDSYSHIIRNIFPDSTKIFNEIKQDRDILNRASGVTKYYDSLIESLPDDSEYNKKKKTYLTLVSIQILEYVRFYVSFACSYYFDNLGLLTGNGNIINLINRDENIHGAFTLFLIKKFKSDESEGFKEIVEDCKDIVRQMWIDSANEEMDWADYLFEGREGLPGLNADLLKQYMKHLVNLRMKALEMEPIFEKTTNPFPWLKKYVDRASVQSAPQEIENVSYLTNALDSNVDMSSIEEMGDLFDFD